MSSFSEIADNLATDFTKTHDPILEAKARVSELRDKGNGVIDLGVGVLKTFGNTIPLYTIKDALEEVQSDRLDTVGYIQVSDELGPRSAQLVYGDEMDTVSPDLIYMPAAGGTNGILQTLLLLKNMSKGKLQLHMGYDSWPNWKNIAHQLDIPYNEHLIADPDLIPNIDGAQTSLSNTPEDSLAVGLEQPGPHNGLALVRDRKYWGQYLDVIEETGGFALFDIPYPAMEASHQDSCTDANSVLKEIHNSCWAVQEAARRKIPHAAVLSFSKIADMYEHRVAMVMVYIPNHIDSEAIADLGAKTTRAVTSFMTVGHVAMNDILESSETKEEWLLEYKDRLDMLAQLHQESKEFSGSSAPLGGMFETIAMPHQRADELRTDAGVIVPVKTKSHTLGGGSPIEAIRINISGLPSKGRDEIWEQLHQK